MKYNCSRGWRTGRTQCKMLLGQSARNPTSRAPVPRRSPIVQQALRDAVPARNHQNPAALGFHFGHQCCLFFQRPLPAACNHNLLIHSNHSFWTVQKDQVSFRTLLSTTRSRTVQTGRLRANRTKRVHSYLKVALSGMETSWGRLITSGRRRW